MSEMFSNLPKSLRIGVVRGGLSHEYDISLQSGGNVLKILSETHEPIDIFISRDGTWHVAGIPRRPEKILKNIDVVWNALHGEYGEDGQIQTIFDTYSVPYTGSNAFSSRITMNNPLTKEHAVAAGIKTPISFIVTQEDSIAEKAKEIFASLPQPLIVKPTCSGSSFGLYKTNSFSELLSALETVLTSHGSAIVEEFIAGKDVSCNVVNNFRGQQIYTFPPVSFSDVTLSREENQSLQSIAKQIHEKLKLSHYSESDFVVSPRRGIYFLEVGTQPTLSNESLLQKSLASVGSSMREFLHHILVLALEGK
jgi:D-alanine-D-alanine ligase